ncbi:MAG: cysteine--tRNA ligase [Actinomycetes bacterium]|nr:cysteine--tRNA ligase [Actinomycetes bacterium]
MSRSKEEFQPREAGRVSMYVCGPTVYNYIHIGNARTFLSFDVVRRYLVWRGWDVRFVQNITDVDDKIIARAHEEGRVPAAVAAEYADAFISEMRALGVEDPTIRPRATETIPAMVALIERLVDDGHAYVTDGGDGVDGVDEDGGDGADSGGEEGAGGAGCADGEAGARDVYFAVRSFPTYGKLSHRNIDELESGVRVSAADRNRKRDPLDFALWKAAKPGEPAWPSPWGLGRPGWHIECSAMSGEELGLPFDIHGGGLDLIFPHHENEIAQSEAATGRPMARYWMHGGMLQTGGEKMSKSLGNFLLLNDLLDNYSVPVIRLLMLQTHYRSPIEFSDERLRETGTTLERIQTFVDRACWIVTASGGAEQNGVSTSIPGTRAMADTTPPSQGLTRESGPDDTDTRHTRHEVLVDAVDKAHAKFIVEMDDDFNTAGALAALFELIREGNSFLDRLGSEVPTDADRRALEAAVDALIELLGVLGVVVTPSGSATDVEAEELLAERTEARSAKDWERADALRDRLDALGWLIEDTAQGPRLVRKE